MIVLSLLLVGIAGKVKAAYCGRYGEPLLQPFFELARLVQRPSVVSPDASWVFRLAPTVTLATVMCAAAVIPAGAGKALLAFDGDFIFFVYVIALGRFFTVLATLDTDSNSGALGAGRYVYFAALMEPAFFIITAALAALNGKTSLSDIYTYHHSGLPVAAACAMLTLMMALVIEAGRMPIDDPANLNSLSVVNDSRPLHYSGIDLAMIQLATATKLSMYATLIAALIIPSNISTAAAIFIYIAIMFLIAVVIGLIESISTRLATLHVAQFIIGASAVALIALSVATLSIITQGGSR